MPDASIEIAPAWPATLPRWQWLPTLALSLLLHLALLVLLPSLTRPGEGPSEAVPATPLSVWLEGPVPAPVGPSSPPAPQSSRRGHAGPAPAAQAPEVRAPAPADAAAPENSSGTAKATETTRSTATAKATAKATETANPSAAASPAAAPNPTASATAPAAAPPPAAAPLDLQDVRRSVRKFAREEQAGKIPEYQDTGPPPVGSRERLAYEVQQSFHPECKDAYPDAGLLRIPFWMVDALRAKGCRW